MTDRPITLGDLRRLVAAMQRRHREHGALFSRADPTLSTLLDTLDAMTHETRTHTITIDASAFHHSRLSLPTYPIGGVIEVRDGAGDLVPAHYLLVDTALGTIRYAGNMEFCRFPYTVTYTV